MAVVVVLIAAASVVVALSTRGPSNQKPAEHLTRLQKEVLASRQQAATWIAQEANRSESVACDPAMCAAIEHSGFPQSDLIVLRQSSPRPPLTSALVVETPYVITLFGTIFNTSSAPMIIAEFGPKATRVEIRVIAPDGAPTLARELAADLANRKNFASTLLGLQGNHPMTFSSVARAQLEKGLPDMRVLNALVALAIHDPIDVIDFGPVGAGASPDLPLRYVDVAENGNIAHPSAPAYVASMLDSLKGLQYPFLRAIKNMKLAHGIVALRIDFSAPSPLGLKGY